MTTAAELIPGAGWPPMPGPDDLRLLAVANPKSRNADAAAAEYRQFQTNGWVRSVGAIDLVHTEKDYADTEHKLLEKLSHQGHHYHGIAVLGGDGALNTVASVVHYNHEELPADLELPLYAGGFGTANDGFFITMGSLDERGKVANQPVIPLRPLETFVLTVSGERRRHLALFYQSLGFTGLSAEYINGDKHRDSRWQGLTIADKEAGKKVREAMTIGKALLLCKRFELIDVDEGTIESTRELLLSHSGRMATMPIYPGDPTDPSFESISPYTRTAIIAALGKVAGGKLLHKNLAGWQNRTSVTVRLGKTPRQGIPMQYDGETSRLYSGDALRIAASRRPLLFVAPALAK